MQESCQDASYWKRREASVTQCCQRRDCADNGYRSTQDINSDNAQPGGKIRVGRVHHISKAKGRPEAASQIQQQPDRSLSDDRRIRTGHRHRLARLDDASGLGVVRIAAGGETEPGHRDAGHKGDNHNLQVGRAVRCVNRVVHEEPPGVFCAAILAKQIPCNCFKEVSRVPQNGFIGCRKRPARERADLFALDKTLQADLPAKGMTFNKPDPAPFRAALIKAGFTPSGRNPMAPRHAPGWSWSPAR
jgi:hypothetical protein